MHKNMRVKQARNEAPDAAILCISFWWKLCLTNWVFNHIAYKMVVILCDKFVDCFVRGRMSGWDSQWYPIFILHTQWKVVARHKTDSNLNHSHRRIQLKNHLSIFARMCWYFTGHRNDRIPLIKMANCSRLFFFFFFCCCWWKLQMNTCFGVCIMFSWTRQMWCSNLNFMQANVQTFVFFSLSLFLSLDLRSSFPVL